MQGRATRMRTGGHNSRTVLASVIAGIFASTTTGVWYDPSDFSSMYQTSNGTLGVTAVEQPVGLMLDKSMGLVRSAEMLPNGDFSGGSTDWSAAAGWTITGGRAEAAVTGGAKYLSSTVATSAIIIPGKFYEVLYTVEVSAGALQIDCGGGTSPAHSGITSTQRRAILRAVNANGFRVYASADAVGWVDNISVKEIPGNHILQATTTARPVLSARVNRFVATEDFTNAIWVKQGTPALTVNANAFVAPDGTTTGDELIQSDSAGSLSVYQTFPDTVVAGAKLIARIRIRAGTVTSAVFSIYNNTAAGHAATSASIVSGPGVLTGSSTRTISGLTTAWTTVELVVDAPVAGNVYKFEIWPSATGAGVSGRSVGLWGAQMEQSNNASNYQRVNSTTDYNTVGFPLYLRFDGVDDIMSTPTVVTLSTTSNFELCLGLAREQSAAIAVVTELGATSNAPNSFGVFAPLTAGSESYCFRIYGTVQVQNSVNYPISSSLVFTGRAYINGGTVMRYNAGTVANNGTSQAGPLADAQLFLGARTGASLPFKGRFYGLMLFARRLSATELFLAEKYLGQRSGVFV